MSILQASDDDNRNDLRVIQSWVLDVTIVPSTKQLAVFAAAKSQFESTENLVYGIGKHVCDLIIKAVEQSPHFDKFKKMSVLIGCLYFLQSFLR